jgi:NAD(P)-dependent dehydrogenase (short-subunit alcohol dehydrogenase family)
MSDPTKGIVLVTGSNRGIGLEMVRQLAPVARRVIATCRRPDAADDLHAVAAEHPDTVEIHKLDVTDPAQIDRLQEEVAGAYGALHLLLNNAGVNGGGTSDAFDSVDMETLAHTFRVNAAGPHVMARAFAPLLKAGAEDSTAGGESVIVNITSQLGSIENTRGRATWQSYRASKAALNMLSRLQANQLRGDGIIVVAMHPGWVQTDMGGSNAAITPESSVRGILDVTTSLSLDDAGQFLTHDGGSLPW